MKLVVVSASDADISGLEPGEAVVVCDTDSEAAGEAAAKIKGSSKARVAIFVGNLTDPALETFCQEIFGQSPNFHRG